MLYDWLREKGELYLDLNRPHSGGSNNSVHFLQSLQELREVVGRETGLEVDISIFRRKQFPVRGTVDAELLTAALGHIPEGQYFTILGAGPDPLAPYEAVGWGEGHEKLREEFARLERRDVRVGQDPFDVPPYDGDERLFQAPKEVFVARFYRHPGPRGSKNRTAYGPFEAEPEKYRKPLAEW